MAVRRVKRMAEILAALLLFAGIMHFFNYLYKGTEDDGQRLTWHSFYEEEGGITNLWLGSSHIYYAVNPQILDEMTGENHFDLGTSLQKLNGTFYLLREAEKNNELKHVYVELYYLCNTKNNFNGDEDPIDTQYDRNWRNTDHMRMSVNKLAYMLSIAGPDYYADILLPFCRYRTKLGDWEYIKEKVEYKSREDYRAYRKEGYRGKGYFEYPPVLQDEEKNFYQNRILGEHSIAEKSDEYLRRIIRYCQERDIPITLFIAPMYDLQLISTVNYDNYSDEVREIAKEYEIPFYDFNLAKEEYLPLRDDDHYGDLNHLNTAGAELFTPFLGQIIQREEFENKKYFYDSYTEKLRETAPALYGIYSRKAEEGEEKTEKSRNMYVASNRDSGMEYRIIMTPEEGEQYLVQDFAENKTFAVSPEEHGICTIVARMADHPDDVVRTMEINY